MVFSGCSVDEVVAAVDGRHGGGESGGGRGERVELAQSGGVEPFAVSFRCKELWSWRWDIAGGAQPGGLRLWSQVVLSAAVNCSRILTLLLRSSGCSLYSDACVSLPDCGLDVIFICFGKVVFLIVCQVSWCGSPGVLFSREHIAAFRMSVNLNLVPCVDCWDNKGVSFCR